MRAVRLELLHRTGDTRREHLTKFHIGEVVIVVLVDAVARSKEGRHLPDRGLRRLRREAREGCVLGDAFVGERGDAALDVVGRADEVGLRRPGPLVGEAPGRVLHGFQVFDAQRGELADRPARLEGGLDRGEDGLGDL